MAIRQGVYVVGDSNRLPMRVVELATAMFARETGFSGPDLHRLYADYTDDLGEYTGWGAERSHAGRSSSVAFVC